jgi:hypothetical protein
MCYYTITLDKASSSSGHTKAIMILDAKDKTEATAKFLNSFGAMYYNDIDVIEGILIPEGFDCLMTEQAKKYILKCKSDKKGSTPLVSYQNMIRLNYA